MAKFGTPHCEYGLMGSKGVVMPYKNPGIGVYGLFSGNECLYVGASKQLKTRWGQHRRSLQHRKHINQKLQAEFDSGKQILFEVLESCKESELRQKEIEYIDVLKPTCNLMVYEGGNGLVHTKEWKKNMSVNNPSKRPEIKEKRREQLIKYNPSRDNLSARLKISTKLKEGYASGRLVPSMLGKHLSRELRMKMSEIRKNPSQEVRKKMSIAQKNRIAWEKKNGIVRENGMKGKHHTQETRQKLSEKQKELSRNRKRLQNGRFAKEGVNYER